MIKEIREEFEKLPATYIADGHHRAASAVKVALKRRAEHPDAPKDAPVQLLPLRTVLRG